MQCLNPIRVRDNDGFYSFVPCGKCLECLQRKHQQWQFRLQQESKHSKSTMVITLTYDDEHLPIDSNGYAQLCKQDIQHFMRNLRKKFGRSVKIRYYIVGEYSPTCFRPHYHGIIFFPNDYVTEDEFYMHAWNSWKKCEKHCLRTDITSPEAINYVSKYVMKLMEIPSVLVPPFALMSRKPGIGSRYLYDENGEPRDEIFNYHYRDLKTYTHVDGGAKVQLPRYYQDKIYNKAQKLLIKEKFLKENYSHAFKIMDEMGAFNGSRFIEDEHKDKERVIYQTFKDKRKL